MTNLNPIDGIGNAHYQGIHWINASAGTGKTFTLTAMIVRLLCSKYLPKQMIATTFTRKAASELRGRVRERLREVLQFFQQHRGDDSVELINAINANNDPLLSAIAQEHTGNIGYVCERLTLALDQYDELYIGTLDSLTQKLLREFSFESGQTDTLTLTEQENQLLYQTIHDALRAWIQQRPPTLIQQLYHAKVLKPVDDYFKEIRQALNFKSAQWQSVAEPSLALTIDEIEQFIQLDLNPLTQSAEWGKIDANLNKHWLKLQQYKQQHFKLNTTEHKDFMDRIPKLLTMKFRTGKDTKPTEQEQQFILQHPILQQVQTFLHKYSQYNQNIEDYSSFLLAYLTQAVQQNFAQVLQQQQETTFAEQTHRLVHALQETTGEHFAQLVHYRYPVILVDEFQDTNHDQDSILQRIWREPKRLTQGCMVMVGDNKQAIYNFRGGDMLIYRRVEQEIEQLAQQYPMLIHRYTLTQNFRSIQPLVKQLQELFLQQPDFGENVHYVQVNSNNTQRLVEQQGANLRPLRYIQMPEGQKDHLIEQTCWQILNLLQQAQNQQLYFEDSVSEEQRPVHVNDIAVLAYRNGDLEKLQELLIKHHVPVYRQSLQSVFNSSIARDVAHFLNAILHPYHEDKLKRVLYSHLFGFRVSDVIEMEQKQQLSRYMQQFAELKEIWLKRGFMTAWQTGLQQFEIWQRLVAEPNHETERFVVNLRHLGDILAEYSEYFTGANHLLTWYEQQLNHPQQREWEIERKLSNQQGIQLLTIHKSKGLEFKIVFLLSANANTLTDIKKESFIFSVSPEQQRIIHVGTNDDLAIQQHEERKRAEQNRLWYVALTRASYRIYAMLEPQGKDTFNGIDVWRCVQPESHQLEPLLETAPNFHYQAETQTSLLIDAHDLPEQRFYAKTKTSFSTLTQHLKAEDERPLEQSNLQKVDDESLIQQGFERQVKIQPELIATTPSHQPHLDLLWIQQCLPKGTLSGSFFHHVIEQLTFTDIAQTQHDNERYAQTVLELERCFKHGFEYIKQQLRQEYQKIIVTEHGEQLDESRIDTQLYHDLIQWLVRMVSTPIVEQMSLQQLPTTHYQRELKFQLALQQQDFNSPALEQLFEQYGIQLNLNQRLSDRYLTGAIDLVFFDGQRYHVLDYKTHHLGNQPQHYCWQNLNANMHYAQYLLQASLYLVALHRYLKCNLQGYKMEKHLGNAHYLYVRGMTGQAQQGVYPCQIEHKLIEELDRFLGYYHDTP